MKKLYNIFDMANRHGVNPISVRRWIEIGKIQPPYIHERQKNNLYYWDDLNDEYFMFLAEKAKKWSNKTVRKVDSLSK